MNSETAARLRLLADRYETPQFLQGDPSWFMHQVSGRANQEVMAFVAATLSYGSRSQFMPKIQQLLDASGGDMLRWVAEGRFRSDLPDTGSCFYRLYTCHTMHLLLCRLQQLLASHGSIGDYVSCHAGGSGRQAVVVLSQFFADPQLKGVVPRPDSACKRLVMFLRWMVRSHSPVDLGLWAHFIDRRSLFIPLDTHVLTQARELGLLQARTQSWATVERLTAAMREVFPDDPARGDFALFGYGVSGSRD
ncbi:MAG: TIGR02757 family protein [Prevotella sp.]|nr:TIGR02757 family protein [Prevotella sp.]